MPCINITISIKIDVECFPPPPCGFAYLINADGAYIVNGDGAFILVKV